MMEWSHLEEAVSQPSLCLFLYSLFFHKSPLFPYTVFIVCTCHAKFHGDLQLEKAQEENDIKENIYFSDLIHLIQYIQFHPLSENIILISFMAEKNCDFHMYHHFFLYALLLFTEIRSILSYYLCQSKHLFISVTLCCVGLVSITILKNRNTKSYCRLF